MLQQPQLNPHKKWYFT